MEQELLTSIVRIVFAVFAGGLIGLERSYNGRPAGFRTHTLVCTASSILMLLTVYQWDSVASAPLETIRVDPIRMAQGIMTGIGFLGAGAIMKDNLTVRGLTTAASIWITAAIGILIGMGLYNVAGLSIVVCLGTLSIFRWLEHVMPSLRYGILHLSFLKGDALEEHELREQVKKLGIEFNACSYYLIDGGRIFKYEITIRTRKDENLLKLSNYLNSEDRVKEYKITPIGP